MPAFRTLNGRGSGLNSRINVKQGGGDKKGGLPYQVGQIQWSFVARGTKSSEFTDRCAGSRCGSILTMNEIKPSYKSTSKGSVGVHIPGLRWR